jgi:hypothetical protein
VQHGTPLAIIAAALGHSDTRMVDRHYAHLAPSHIADLVQFRAISGSREHHIGSHIILVQFWAKGPDKGELATAFVPNPTQLSRILFLLD